MGSRVLKVELWTVHPNVDELQLTQIHLALWGWNRIFTQRKAISGKEFQLSTATIGFRDVPDILLVFVTTSNVEEVSRIINAFSAQNPAGRILAYSNRADELRLNEMPNLIHEDVDMKKEDWPIVISQGIKAALRLIPAACPTE